MKSGKKGKVVERKQEKSRARRDGSNQENGSEQRTFGRILERHVLQRPSRLASVLLILCNGATYQACNCKRRARSSRIENHARAGVPAKRCFTTASSIGGDQEQYMIYLAQIKASKRRRTLAFVAVELRTPQNASLLQLLCRYAVSALLVLRCCRKILSALSLACSHCCLHRLPP